VVVRLFVLSLALGIVLAGTTATASASLRGSGWNELMMRSVAWSNDGGFVARSLLDGSTVLIHDLRTGRAQTLRSFGTHFAWAPRGSELAGLAGGGFVFRPDGTGYPFGRTANNFDWDPAGRIVYDTIEAPGPYAIYIRESDGAQRRLTAGRTPKWSPDGRRIAFTDGICQPSAPACNRGLFVIGSDGGGRTLLANLQYLGATGLTWAPDGTAIAYSDPSGGVFVVSADGSVRYRIADRGAPLWSPDGSRIAIVLDGRLTLMDRTGGRATRLGPGVAAAADWSPDGTRLSFSTGNALYVVNADGTGLREVADAWFGAWSPDGRRLAIDGTMSDTDCVDPIFRLLDPATRGVRYFGSCSILGTSGRDSLNGTDGVDEIDSFDGADTIRLRRGADVVRTWEGRDVVYARDRSVDNVDCGSGRDRVFADRRDIVARNCEVVRRR
jgi:Tol biopolymer transport system component